MGKKIDGAAIIDKLGEKLLDLGKGRWKAEKKEFGKKRNHSCEAYQMEFKVKETAVINNSEQEEC